MNKHPSSDLKNSSSFVGSKERYQEPSSSAWSFLAAAGLILLLLLLVSFRILPLPITLSEHPVMFHGLCLITLIFFVIGIVSLKNAAAYKQGIQSEQELEKGVLDWFYAAHTGERIDQAIEQEEGNLPQSEILSLKRLEFIHTALLAQFPDLPENHADALGETIYQKLFE